ncbi:MAG: hypothetical protein ACYTET_01665, partial [Planctomycetota bacterium]
MTHSISVRIITGMGLILCIFSQFSFAASPSRQVWTYDFVQQRSNADIVRQLQTDFRQVQCGGISKPAIYEHAGILGDEWVEITYRNVPIPSKAKGVEKITLDFFTGIEDTEDFKTERGVDGCRFILRVNGKQVFSYKQDTQQWNPHRVNLMRHAGKDVTISFLIDPLRSSSVDRAAWGQPRIVAGGDGMYLQDLAILHGQATPHQPKIEYPHARITRVNKDETSLTMVAVLDETLDLDTQFLVGGHYDHTAAEPLPPRLVAGQGDGEENRTLVRILTEQSVPEMQFLAYPPYVRGGVQVEAGKDNLGYLRIITAPISDSEVCHLRIFTEHGGFLRNITVGGELSAPFVINVGQYDAHRPGEEIAVTSRYQKADCPVNVLFYGIDGAFITHRQLETKTDTQVVMETLKSPGRDTLYIYLESQQQAHVLESISGTDVVLPLKNIDSIKDKTFQTAPFHCRIDVKQLSTYGVSSEQVKDLRIGP